MPAHASRTIPAMVISGFLGAGKTTFLNHLLSGQDKLRVAVIINEAGSVNIDHGLVEWNDDSVVELSNGCVCCTVRSDLIQAIVRLLRKSSFDYLVIETTGLADPGPVAQTFFNVPELLEHVKLDSIVCLVDALNFHRQKQESTTVLRQVEMSDFILLNKTDLVTKDQVAAVKTEIHTLNPHATLFETTNALAPLELLMDAHAFDIGEKLEIRPDLLDETRHTHDETIRAHTLIYPQPFELKRFQDAVNALSDDLHILRAKGILHFKGETRRAIFHGVNDRYSIYWDQKIPAKQSPRNELVFIGSGLPGEELNRLFASCIS